MQTSAVELTSPEEVVLVESRSGARSVSSSRKRTEYAVSPHVEPDAPKLAYYVFYLLGMGTLLPWNFFITADSYWNYKFRNVTVDTSGNNSAADTTTDLQYNFSAYLSVAAMLPNTIFLILNAIFAEKIDQQLKLVVSLIIMIVLFIVTTILVPINSDQWQHSFFVVTMLIVVLINVGAAVLQGGLFGLSAQFPSKYLSAVMSGQGLGAVFACLCRIASIAIAGEDEIAAAVYSALVYFMLADATLLLSLACYLWMTTLSFYKYYTFLHGPEKRTGEAPSRAGSAMSVSLWHIFLKIKWYALSVFLVFTVTIAMFPAVAGKIRPMHEGTKEEPSIWARDYFVPVCCFLLFNAADYIGRVGGGFTIWPKKDQWCIILLLVVLRVAFVPLFMYCNVDHKNLTTVFNHDVYYIIFMAFFGLSNGYLATLVMIYGPASVEPEEQNTASSMLAAFLGIGLSMGALLSNVSIKII